MPKNLVASSLAMIASSLVTVLTTVSTIAQPTPPPPPSPGATTTQVPARASVNGKYKDLIQVMKCPADRTSYGAFSDYGYWSGGAWCNQTGKAGYWVWVEPNWYVWKTKTR